MHLSELLPPSNLFVIILAYSLSMKDKIPPGSPESFYAKILEILSKANIPFLIGGTYAIREYTQIQRETKDIDIFCKAGDYLKIIKLFSDAGFKTEVTDARWIAKIFDKDLFVDLIFGTAEGIWHVDDSWFTDSPSAKLMDSQVKLIPPEELIWSKAYMQDRRHFDGADVNHLILKQGGKLDWKRLATRMEIHWEVLFAHIINFRFVYPSERDIVPRWLIEEYLSRIKLQLDTPTPMQKVCRGPLISPSQYIEDIKKWGYQFRENPGE